MEQVTMMTFIKETPNQLETNIKNRTTLTKELVDLYCQKKYKKVWIIACGSSLNSSLCARAFMMKYLQCDIKIVNPSSFLYYENQLDQDDFVFVISQSGCSTNSIDALKKLKELGIDSIGLTGNINSDFKDYATHVIDYGVGIETIGYVTKGVCTLVLFLILFALESAKKLELINETTYDAVIKELEEVPSRHQTIQDNTLAFYELNEKTLLSMTVAYSCGFIQSFGIANEAALKIGETIKVPSFPYEAEEYIHGPNLQLTPNYTVFLIDDFSIGTKRMEQIYLATQSVTDKTFFITNSSVVDDTHAIRVPFDIHEPLLSPLYILPVFQIISYMSTSKLNCWKQHPSFNKFKSFAQSKTETINDIMIDND